MSQAAPLVVGIDARGRSGETGGVQQVVLGLATALGELPDTGDRYLLLALRGDDEWIRGARGPRTRLVHEQRTARQLLVGEVKRHVGRRFPGLRSRYRASMSAAAIDERVPVSGGELERAGAEVIHFVRQGAFLTDVPSIYHPWDLQHLHFPEFFTEAEIRSRELRYRAFCQAARLVVVASTWTKADLVARYGLSAERIAVVPVPSVLFAYAAVTEADLAGVRRSLGLPEGFLFYPANTWPHKNHVRLIEAIAIARRTIPDLGVVCSGGQTGAEGEIRAALERHSLGSAVRFVGFVSPRELQALYRSARGLIFPSLFEGWGLPVVEAFSAGLPVATSTATSLATLAGDAALTFDPTDVEAMAAAAISLWSDRDRTDDLRERGLARARLFDPHRIARTYRAHYRLVAGRALAADEEELIRAAPDV